jgi:hypothetical protein
LFQDSGLRKRLQSARSQDEALGLVVGAGAVKGLTFTAEDLKRLISVFASPPRKDLSDAELKAVAGGARMMADGTHIHMSCCTDCPKSAALCCKSVMSPL